MARSRGILAAAGIASTPYSKEARCERSTAFLLASLLPAVASAQPHAFAVWERPAVGVFVGPSGNGDQNSRASGAEADLEFDTPVVFGYRLRAV